MTRFASDVIRRALTLQRGEEFAVVAFPGRCHQGRFTGAVRVHVMRPIETEETGYDVRLQVSEENGEWKHWIIRSEGMNGYDYGYGPNTEPEEMPRLLSFFELVIETETPLSFEEAAKDDLASILALKPWETYTRLLFDVHEIEPACPDYAGSVRLSAEHDPVGEWIVQLDVFGFEELNGWSPWSTSATLGVERAEDLPSALDGLMSQLPSIRNDIAVGSAERTKVAA